MNKNKIIPIEYKFRAAHINDSEDLAQVHLMGRSSYVGFVKQSDLEEISYNSYLNSRHKIMENNNITTLVATFNNQIIGFCDYGFLSEDNCQRASYLHTLKAFKGELINLFLHPDHQKVGVGGYLFDQAQFALREKQLVPFMLWTLKENKFARSFYESRGGILIANMELPIKFGQTEYPQVAYRFD